MKLKKEFRTESNLDVFAWDENNNVVYTQAYVNWLEKQLNKANTKKQKDFVSFANFAKSYCSPKKVEEAFYKWNNKEIPKFWGVRGGNDYREIKKLFSNFKKEENWMYGSSDYLYGLDKNKIVKCFVSFEIKKNHIIEVSLKEAKELIKNI